MAESFQAGALMGHVYRLGDGTCVRLRLARGSDAPAIRRLLQQDGADDSVEVLPLVHFDPRQTYVLCATGLVDLSEILLGVGAIGFDGAHGEEPELLVIAEEHREELAPLLTRALMGTADAPGRRRAA